MRSMDIVDRRCTSTGSGSNWQHTQHDVIVDYAVATMDALGLSAILIDEWAGFDNPVTKRGHLPGHFLPNGAVRGEHPFSETAIKLHPDRFAYVARIDPIDPDVEELMAGVARSRRVVPPHRSHPRKRVSSTCTSAAASIRCSPRPNGTRCQSSPGSPAARTCSSQRWRNSRICS